MGAFQAIHWLKSIFWVWLTLRRVTLFFQHLKKGFLVIYHWYLCKRRYKCQLNQKQSVLTSLLICNVGIAMHEGSSYHYTLLKSKSNPVCTMLVSIDKSAKKIPCFFEIRSKDLKHLISGKRATQFEGLAFMVFLVSYVK